MFPKIQRTMATKRRVFRARKSATGNVIAGPQVQHIREIIPKIGETKIRQNGFFSEPVTLVVKEN